MIINHSLECNNSTERRVRRTPLKWTFNRRNFWARERLSLFYVLIDSEFVTFTPWWHSAILASECLYTSHIHNIWYKYGFSLDNIAFVEFTAWWSATIENLIYNLYHLFLKRPTIISVYRGAVNNYEYITVQLFASVLAMLFLTIFHNSEVRCLN